MKLVGGFRGVPIYEENEDKILHRIILPRNAIDVLFNFMSDGLTVTMTKEEQERFIKQHIGLGVSQKKESGIKSDCAR